MFLTLTKFVTAVDTACIGRLRSGISWPASPSSWMMTSRDTWNKCRFNFNSCMLRYVVCYNLTSFSIILCKILKESLAHKKIVKWRVVTPETNADSISTDIAFDENHSMLNCIRKRCQVLEYQKTRCLGD